MIINNLEYNNEENYQKIWISGSCFCRNLL